MRPFDLEIPSISARPSHTARSTATWPRVCWGTSSVPPASTVANGCSVTAATASASEDGMLTAAVDVMATSWWCFAPARDRPTGTVSAVFGFKLTAAACNRHQRSNLPTPIGVAPKH